MTESPGRRRARLSGGEVALIVVVATLVVVFLAMLLGRLTADGTPTASPTPEALSTAAPTAGPTTPGASDVVDLAEVAWTFRLPSGNIGCALDADGVLCAIDAFDYEAPEIAGCAGDTGVAFRIDASGTSPVCSAGKPALGEVQELPYGESETAGEFTCDSTEAGVACRNSLGHEITLRRSAYGL